MTLTQGFGVSGLRVKGRRLLNLNGVNRAQNPIR